MGLARPRLHLVQLSIACGAPSVGQHSCCSSELGSLPPSCRLLEVCRLARGEAEARWQPVLCWPTDAACTNVPCAVKLTERPAVDATAAASVHARRSAELEGRAALSHKEQQRLEVLRQRRRLLLHDQQLLGAFAGGGPLEVDGRRVEIRQGAPSSRCLTSTGG